MFLKEAVAAARDPTYLPTRPTTTRAERMRPAETCSARRNAIGRRSPGAMRSGLSRESPAHDALDTTVVLGALEVREAGAFE